MESFDDSEVEDSGSDNESVNGDEEVDSGDNSDVGVEDNEDDDDDDDNADGDMFPQESVENDVNGVNGLHEDNGVDEDDKGDEEDQPSSKRRRVISKSMTSAEASALSSAETSLSASLLKFQSEEMLKEIQIPDEIRTKKIETLVEKIEKILQNSATSKSAAAKTPTMLQHIEQVDGVRVPFPVLAYSAFKAGPIGGSFQYAPPASVGVTGCYRLGVVCKPKILVDVAVEIPASVFQKKDLSNFRYAFKRAAYLAQVAAILKKEMNEFIKSGAEMIFEGPAHDPLRSRLLIIPNWSFVKREKDLEIVFSIFCFANENPNLPADKLRFENSLVEAEWFFGEAWKNGISDENGHGEKPSFYAANYENDLLRDLTYRRNQTFLTESVYASSATLRQGVMLLQTWLRQRDFDDDDGISATYLSIFVAYLLIVKKLTKETSAVQVFRKMLVAFSNNVFETGVGLCGAFGEDVENRRQRLETFFDVVVLDRTGSCNLTPTLTKLTLRRVGLEARAALSCLDNAHSQDSFDALFMHRVPHAMQFDQIFVVRDAREKAFESVVERQKLWASVFRDSGATTPSSVSFIIRLLERALGRRITSIAVLPLTSLTKAKRRWPLGSKPSSISQSESRIGLNLNVEAYASIIEKGPAPEEQQEVEVFRRFWGSKVETRRFKDATIAEAVVWTAKTVEVKRRLNIQIVEHSLFTHAGIAPKEIQFIGDQVEKKTLRFKKMKLEQPAKKLINRFGTGEEQQTACLAAFEALAKTLRSLSDIKSQDALPLRITSVQGVSPVFRQTDPCPPLPSFYGQSNALTDSQLRSESATVSLGKKGARIDQQMGDRVPKDCHIPDWVPTLQGLLTLELSGKWPEDLNALRRIKSSFLTSVCKCLRGMGVSASLSIDSVKVLKDGFVFELKIAHPRELALMKREDAENDDDDKDETSLDSRQSVSAAFQRRHFALPHIASVINGLNAQYPAFGPTCRLLKRWVASQLLIDFFPDDGVALELIVAYSFLHPHPFAAAAAVNPQSGFLRALRLLSTWNWKLTPMIVNFNEEFTAKDYREKHRELTSLRRRQIERFTPTSTPALFIVTPYDKTPSEWTINGPPLIISSRLVAVARASLQLIVDSLGDISTSHSAVLSSFRPPLDGFYAVIHLRKNLLPTRCWSVDSMEAPESLTTHLKARSKGLMPVNGFDPARRLIEDLRRCYDDICFFFHDPFGGDVIGVLWRPDALRQRPIEDAVAMPGGGGVIVPGLRFEEKTIGALTGDVIEDLDKKKIYVEFNIQAFVEDVKAIGDGIVQDVQVNVENWN